MIAALLSAQHRRSIVIGVVAPSRAGGALRRPRGEGRGSPVHRSGNRYSNKKTCVSAADEPHSVIAVCQHQSVKTRQLTRFFGVVALTVWTLPGIALPATSAFAQPCPDVEAVFARGTDEDSGFGPTGQEFIDALHSKISGKSFGTYAVNYPATNDWPTGVDGIRDASTHIQSVAANCPKTKMVLGGFSQGAAVMGFVTANVVPDGVDAAAVPQPMPPEVANHVAAVVLFGTPNTRAMDFLGQPPVVIGPLYAAKTIQLCAPEDPVCSEGLNFAAHNSYSDAGMVDEGANYAARRLEATRV